MQLFFRTKISVLSWFSRWLERINNLAVDSIFATSNKIRTSEAAKRLKELCENADLIMEKATKYSQGSNFVQDERDLAYYYYLLKHYSADYESRFGLVAPIQVFNEHRMALDHFIRAKSSAGTDRERQHEKAANHILRGLLDILKLSCAKLREITVKKHATFPAKVLGGASDGEYIKEYIELQKAAENKLYRAKCIEYGLEPIESQKSKAVDSFIQALIAHSEWHEFQSKKMGVLRFHFARYYCIKGLTLLGSVAVGVVATVIANYFFDIIRILEPLLTKIFAP